MLSSCWFLNRGGRKEGKQNLSEKSQTPHWLWQQLLSEDRLRLEGLCSVLPLVFLQESASNRPEATDYKPGHSCSTQPYQDSGMKKANYQWYNTSHSRQRDHSTAPAKISAFHCPKITTDLRDSGSHWSWDVKRVPWVQNCPPERSKVKLCFFFPWSTCMCMVSPCKTRGRTMLMLCMEPHSGNYWVTFSLWIKKISVTVLLFLLLHKYQISNFFKVISNYCMKRTSGDERCLSLDKCKS